MDLNTLTYSQLEKQLNFDIELPISPDWSAAADFLYLIKEHCLNVKPQTIVECSSGITTLVLARCCEINNSGKIFSLENADEFARLTQQNLTDFRLDEYAKVIHAPLKKIVVNNVHYNWYETEKLPNRKINMLVIDGPPGFMQKHSRLPALPLLLNQLADQSVVFLDDAARDEEKEIVDMWLALATGIKHEFIETERGCSILTICK